MRSDIGLGNPAFVDASTGAATFALLREQSRQLLALARRHGHTAALLHIDLDAIRTIGTSLGADIGDQLLRRFTDRLRQALRESDVIARGPADDFLVLLSAVAEADAAARVVRRLSECVSRPFQVRDHSISIAARFGVALYPADATTFDELLDYAAFALNRARSSSSDYEFYRVEVTDRTLEHLSMEDDLRWAWERKQFALHYQPVVAVADGRIIGAEALARGRVIGVEALARWPQLDRGEITPSQFIPVAERTGRIVALDRWAIATATRQAVLWSQDGWSGWVSVNLSARSLHDADLPSYIDRCLDTHGLERGRLVLEVTESTAMRDTSVTARILTQLRDAGALIALDDFGAGHSSLAYIRHFPVDLLKLDHNFMQDLGREPKHGHLVEAIITLAHRIGAQVVAEGIEHDEQLRWLRDAQCDFVQGYLIGRPQPADVAFELNI